MGRYFVLGEVGVMDEQRGQAYLQLIQELLSCPSGEEPAVLQRNQNLIDTGLVQVMGQVIKILQEQGGENEARFLENITEQLAKSLKGQTTSEQQSDSDVMDFLMQVLQVIEQTPDPQIVYPLLEENLDKINFSLLESLENWAKKISKFNPEEQQILARVFFDLGRLFEQFPFNRLEVLEIAISSYGIAKQVFSRNRFTQEWAAIQNNLGNTYAERIRGDRDKNLEKAIFSYRLALQIYNPHNFLQEWATAHNNLATSYTERIRGEKAENLEQAILNYELALQAYSRRDFPEEWAMTHNNLATAFKNRIQGKKAENLEQAILNYELALQVYTYEDFPRKWAITQNNLSNAFSDRIRGEKKDNLEKAILALECSLKVRTREHYPQEWAMTQNNLATAYIARIKGKKDKNIEKSITLLELALQIYRRDKFPNDWAMTQSNLAIAYYSRIQGKRSENIEKAITSYQLALQIYRHDKFTYDWAKNQSDLATAYYSRIHGERLENIEKAIAGYQLALKVRTEEQFPEDWANTQHNLAAAYISRLKGSKSENIEKAITSYQLVLKVRTREAFPEGWSATQNNLAAAYIYRLKDDRLENIEKALIALHLSLQVRTRNSFPQDWAETHNNLAAAYAFRIKGNGSKNLEKAIAALQLSLQVYTHDDFPQDWAKIQNNLASIYCRRIQGQKLVNTKRAISIYWQALTVRKPDSFPNDCRKTARNLANLYADNHRYQDSLHPYQLALTATENLYQASISRFGQEAELKETNDLYRRAAYAHAKTNDLQHALEILEQGRARGLSETLQRDRANLDQIEQQNPELFNRYQTAANTLRNLEAIERSNQLTNENWSKSNADQATQTRAELKTCIAEIRQIPGYETFLALPTFADITQSLQPHRPLIYLTITPSGSLALILTPTESEPTINAIWLDNLNESDLIKLLNEQWLPASRNISKNFPNWLNTIDTITRQLWDQVMETIVNHLETQHITQATLIPTGYLSLLPLHAAWTEDPNTKTGRRYACDKICFTTAPNARSLQTAQAIAKNTSVSTLLAIDDPTHNDPNQGNLPSSAAEVTTAVATFPSQAKTLAHNQATREAVLAEIPNHNVLHFSCHGYANFNEPLKSGLAMANQEILSLSDLFNLKLDGVRLAILSACETGLPGTELPDEVVSLPTGLLQAGVAGVVASLWSVSDLSTMLLLTRFYDFWHNDNLEPAKALHQAQQWLRDTTNDEKLDYYDPQVNANTRIPKAIARDIYNRLYDADHNFAHPFHWAAFTYTGV
ncbi:MAG: CHAT domain-containing protein [Spirulina sp. SIO3F2]|nr:CHAT domain-containing protein [Spirulina sp. SIO3F2]